ncbi:MAG TPA: hypothetical protein VJB70_00605 [Candidatus Paceibacterota bacterium]
MRFGKFKNIFFVILGIIALFVAYSVFMVGDSQDSSAVLVSENERSGRAPSSATELLRVLDDLQKIKLDSRFFIDEAYRSLRDWSVRLVPEPEGRINPFAPFSSK